MGLSTGAVLMTPTAACNTQCAQIAHTVLPCSALHCVFLAGQATSVWPAGHQGRLPNLQPHVERIVIAGQKPCVTKRLHRLPGRSLNHDSTSSERPNLHGRSLPPRVVTVGV